MVVKYRIKERNSKAIKSGMKIVDKEGEIY
jgi:hypothetical protein